MAEKKTFIPGDLRIEGLTQEQILALHQILVTFVESHGGTVGGGFIPEVSDGEDPQARQEP